MTKAVEDYNDALSRLTQVLPPGSDEKWRLYAHFTALGGCRRLLFDAHRAKASTDPLTRQVAAMIENAADQLARDGLAMLRADLDLWAPGAASPADTQDTPPKD